MTNVREEVISFPHTTDLQQTTLKTFRQKYILIFSLNERKITERSTEDHLIRFETFIREAFILKEHVVSVFFDLESAYDTHSTNWLYYHITYSEPPSQSQPRSPSDGHPITTTVTLSRPPSYDHRHSLTATVILWRPPSYDHRHSLTATVLRQPSLSHGHPLAATVTLARSLTHGHRHPLTPTVTVLRPPSYDHSHSLTTTVTLLRPPSPRTVTLSRSLTHGHCH